MDWTNINQPKKKNNAKVEKYLVDINMSDEIKSVDNFLLKSSLLDCLVKYLRSRPIQTRAFQLLHDLVVTTQEVCLFSDEDLTHTFTLVNSSLKVWEGNEYVSAACFEFLAALYTKCVTIDFPDFNCVLLGNALSFLERLRKSKAVVKAVTSFLEKIYQQSGENIAPLPVSSSILTLVVDLLSQYGMDNAISYTCCQVIAHLTSYNEAYVSDMSYKIVVVVLSTMSSKHSNTNFFNFVGLLLHILKDVVREEKHIIYLLSDEEEEFVFICGCIPNLQEINDVGAISAALEIILRVVSSSYIRKVNDKPRVIQAIGDGLLTARQHREGCDGGCLETEGGEGKDMFGSRASDAGKCSVTQRHVVLSNSIEQFFKTLPGYDEYMHQQQKDEQSVAVYDNIDADSQAISIATTVISVNLISASDLINSDIVGVSDPYVILSLPNQSATSKTINNDLDPVFNQHFSFLWNGSDPLQVEVWDFDAFKPDDPIGHCRVDLSAMQLSASTAISVDLPLEGVEHGRIQMDIQLQDKNVAATRCDTLASAEGSTSQQESVSPSPKISTQQQEQSEDEKYRTVLPDMSDLSIGDGSATDVDDTPAGHQNSGDDHSFSVEDIISENKKKNQPPFHSPSYSTKTENDDVMMVMIRALQDEVEDWKQKYTDMKWAHDALVKATEENYNQSLSPDDVGHIQFDSFDKMQNTSPSISPIKNEELFSNHPNNESKLGHIEIGSSNDIVDDRDECSRPDDFSSANGDTYATADGSTLTPTDSRRNPGTPASAKKAGSDFAASVTGMKSAFCFCMSPSEGRNIDINDLMSGGELGSKGTIDDDVAMDLYKTLKWLFKHLRSIQSTNMEKMFLQMVLPRSLLRKFLLEDFLQLFHIRRFQVQDIDIILHNVPSKLKFPDFVFVLVACASKRFAARDNLNSMKSSVLARLNDLIKAYIEEYNATSRDSSEPEQASAESCVDKREVSHPLPPSSVITEKIPEELRAFGMESLRKQDHVWKQLYCLYSAQRRDKRINFESLLMFTKDFNICPALISNSECFEIFEAVINLNGKPCVLSKQPAVNYHEFLCILFEIAIVSNCFGEEDQQFKLSSKENIWKKVLNFLWFLESSKERIHIREKTLLPNFKINRNALIVEDRLVSKKKSTNLQLSILKFK